MSTDTPATTEPAVASDTPVSSKRKRSGWDQPAPSAATPAASEVSQPVAASAPVSDSAADPSSAAPSTSAADGAAAAAADKKAKLNGEGGDTDGVAGSDSGSGNGTGSGSGVGDGAAAPAAAADKSEDSLVAIKRLRMELHQVMQNPALNFDQKMEQQRKLTGDIKAQEERRVADMTSDPSKLKPMFQRRLYVGNFDPTIDEPVMRATLARFGPIYKLDVPLGPDGKSHLGYCFVEFTDPEFAESARMNLQVSPLAGRTLTVGTPTGEDGMGIPIRPQVAPPAPAMAAGGFGMRAPAPAARTERNPMARLYVGSVPFEISAAQLEAVFSPFGKIISCNLLPPTGQTAGYQHRGYGFIEYESVEVAQLAIKAMDKFEIGGRNLKVGYAAGGGGGADPPRANSLAMSGIRPTATEGVGSSLAFGMSMMGRK